MSVTPSRAWHFLVGLMLREPPPSRPPAGRRDLRLDFFRGLALWWIFLNHIPNNSVSWISNRNWGFSDATEIFVFISGYAATLAYGGTMRQRGFLAGAARVWRRTWQLYSAHIILFVIFIAQITYLAKSFENPMFSEEMNLMGFIGDPHIYLSEALLLKFKPVNMDVLPLYIVLLLGFPFVLFALLRHRHAVLAASAVLYGVATQTDLNLPAYPDGQWFFNPFAWQFLFVIGAWCALSPSPPPWHRLKPALFVPCAAIYLVFSLLVVATWNWSRLSVYMPQDLADLLYPVSKANLDILRLMHFLSLAYLTTRLAPPDAAFPQWRIFRPIVLCGQHSLSVFCFGIFLSFAAYSILVELHGRMIAELCVSIIGIASLTGMAYGGELLRRLERDPPGGGRRQEAAAE